MFAVKLLSTMRKMLTVANAYVKAQYLQNIEISAATGQFQLGHYFRFHFRWCVTISHSEWPATKWQLLSLVSFVLGAGMKGVLWVLVYLRGQNLDWGVKLSWKGDWAVETLSLITEHCVRNQLFVSFGNKMWRKLRERAKITPIRMFARTNCIWPLLHTAALLF